MFIHETAKAREPIAVVVLGMAKKSKMTLDKLARLMQGEFLNLSAGMNKRFDKLEADVLELRMDLDNIKLRHDQEKVYRFEIRNLEKRLNRLEARLGIKRNML